METILPREQIPESWLEKSRCPYCSSAPLKIEHPAGQADHFACPNCELAFQVAKNGPTVLVVRDPLGVSTGLQGQWVEMKVLVQRIKDGQTTSKPLPIKAEEPASQSDLSPEISHPEQPVVPVRDPIYEKYPAGVIENAAELYALGNSKSKIKEILSRYSKLSDDEVDEIVQYITRKPAGRTKGTFKFPRWALGCILVPFFCLVLYGIIFFVQYRAASSLAAGADPKVVTLLEYEKLPRALKELIPEEVQQVQMPLAVVTKLESSAGETQICPQDGAGAAALFGGDALEWQYNTEQQAWMMQAVESRSLVIPENYLSIIPIMNKGLSIQLVPGPAKVDNAYLLLVRCP